MNVATLLNADGTVKTTKYTAGGGGGGATIVDNFADLASLTGMTAGSQAYVTATNNLYFYTGVGWYLIATVQNDAPSAITGVDVNYNLALDGTPTVVTAVSTDPEGFPLTWTYTASGLGSIATVSQADNVFTLTPSTDEVNEGSFTLTISTTDGINGSVSTIPSFSLEFIIQNSNYTILLAAAVSTGDNNNITDASSNNHTITVAGDPISGSFSPYRHGGYSTHFDGTGDYLNAPGNTAFEFGTDDFNIELFFNRQTSGSFDSLLTYGDTTVTGHIQNSWGLYISDSNYLNFDISDGTAGGAGKLALISNVLFPTNSWVHISVVREGNNFTLYQNGNAVSTTTDNRSAYVSPSPLLWIGRNHSAGTADTAGWFSNVRIVKGTAVYTGNFTPPTESLTAITNTSLLTCHLPYIVDGSTNAHAITVNGNVYTTPFNTYEYTPTYSAVTNGGSVHFDGVGDYLDISNDASLTIGTGDFTSECWVFVESGATLMSYWRSCFSLQGDGHTVAGSISIYISNGTDAALGALVVIANANSSRLHSTADVRGQWTHVAIARESGTIRFFVNGSLASSASDTTNYNATGPTRVGVSSTGQSNYWLGYVADARFVKGTAVYTAAFTPPTAPLSSSDASLHIKGTDASIVDKSQVSNNLKLVGNTTGSTTQIKYGNSSIYFDGTGDAVTASSSNFAFGTGDFTVEFWNYNSSLHNYITMASTSPRSSTSWSCGTDVNAIATWYNSAAGRILESPAGTYTLNTWHHTAYVRSNGTIKVYVDGVERDSATDTINYDKTDFCIGALDNGSEYMVGYMDDIRISKTAIYTANFTPPTESLKG